MSVKYFKFVDELYNSLMQVEDNNFILIKMQLAIYHRFHQINK